MNICYWFYRRKGKKSTNHASFRDDIYTKIQKTTNIHLHFFEKQIIFVILKHGSIIQHKNIMRSITSFELLYTHGLYKIQKMEQPFHC